MVRTLLRAVVALAALVAVLARLARLPVSEPRRPAGQRSVTYPRLRHLIIATVFLVVALWFIFWLAAQIENILTILTVSIILAVALRPTVDRIQNTRMPRVNRTIPRALAILILYLAIAAVAAGIAFLVIPQVIFETSRLIANLPEYASGIEEALGNLQRRFPFVPNLSDLAGQAINQLLGNLSQAIDVLLFVVNVLTGILSFLVVLVITFFFLMDAELIHEHLISLIPPSSQPRAREMTAKMGRKIEGWLMGTLILAAFIGGATSLAMWLLDMPFPLLLGLAAGLAELVPLIGAYLGAAPAGAIALFTQPLWKFIAVTLYFFGIQQIENNVLAPNIMSRQVDMPPLLVIVALLVGATLKGIVGALVAVPVAAVVQVLWTDLLVPEVRRRQTQQ